MGEAQLGLSSQPQCSAAAIAQLKPGDEVVAVGGQATPAWETATLRILDELLDDGEKKGVRGRVLDINLVYTTLQEDRDGPPGAVLQVPNSLFFQKSVRRWREPMA